MNSNNRKGKYSDSVNRQATVYPKEFDCLGFVPLGDNLVSSYLIQGLLNALVGKVIPSHSVVSIPELCGSEFYEGCSKETRAVLGECLVMLINKKYLEVGEREK